MIKEGEAKIKVLNGVFYNPYASLSRDLGIAFVKAASVMLNRKIYVCEPLSATGIRGIRYVLETNSVQKILLNDKSRIAYENILENVKLNNIENICIVENKDASILLFENSMKGKRFDFVDIDPFGSPIKFVYSAINAIVHKGFLAVSATDTAALCGVAKRAATRKYSVMIERTEFMHEVGIRVLASSIIRIGSSEEIAFEPIYSHSTRHYMRVYFRVYVSRNKCDSILNNIGYLYYCKNCLWRNYSYNISKNFLQCPVCNNDTVIIGPLWLGKIVDKAVAEIILKNSNNSALPLAKSLLEEAEMPPFFYDIDKLCSRLKISCPPLSKVIDELKKDGYKACRTHFHNKGVKTNADLLTMNKILLSSKT